MAETDAGGDSSEEIETPPQRTPEQLSSDWQAELGLAEDDHKDFCDDGRTVVDRYKSEKENATTGKRTSGKKFNILFSNTEVLRSALYGKAAKPDVRRRFADPDPVARVAAEVVERALIYCGETYDVDKPIEQGILDYLLPGRGTVRVEYEPIIKERPSIDPMTMQPVIGQDGKPATESFIAEQLLRERYVYWEDYRQSPARNWEGVWWNAYRHVMGRTELRELLTQIPQTSKSFIGAEAVPLDWAPEMSDRRPAPDSLKKAEVWEIWDKRTKQRVWIVNGCTKALRLDQDPYGLEGFFCQPEPLISYSTNDTAIPEPEFHAYKDQADDLDEITARISILTRALKRRGVRDQSIKELGRLAKGADNDFIPVADWTNLTAKGGLSKVFETEDVSAVGAILGQLYQQRDMLVQAIFELMGIADIMRGNSDPDETLGAQQMKAQFGSTRLKRRQRAVQRWIRDLYKIKAEIIAEHFEPQILSEMTGQQVSPDVMNILRSDKLRAYRIDIETDSTIFEDSSKQQADTANLLKAVTEFITAWAPILAQQPAMLPLAKEMLAMAVRSFKAGRALEDAVEQVANTLDQIAQQKMSQPPPPDPKAAQAQADIAQTQMETQQKSQAHNMDMQGKQLDMQGKQIDLQAKTISAQAEVAKARLDAQHAAFAQQAAQIGAHQAAQQRATGGPGALPQ